MVNGYHRGYNIYADNGQPWRYTEDDKLVAKVEKPCFRCGHVHAKEAPDRCIGHLPGVLTACCGHGEPQKAYIKFKNGARIDGEHEVRKWIEENIKVKKEKKK